MKRSERGQAFLELAIFGTLALIALAFVLRMGLTANYQQEIDQQTFRWAQRLASNIDKETNGRGPHSVTVIHIRDRQMPDPGDGFATMPRVLTQASSVVTWGRFLHRLTDDPESQPLTIVQVNDAQRHFTEKELDPDAELIGQINTTAIATGTSSQDQAGSRLRSTMSHETELSLNTKSPSAPVGSALTSDVELDW